MNVRSLSFYLSAMEGGLEGRTTEGMVVEEVQVGGTLEEEVEAITMEAKGQVLPLAARIGGAIDFEDV